jgi:esterase/lipase
MTWFKRLASNLSFKRKPALLCLHGFGVRRTEEFRPLVTYFSDLGYRVYTPELFDQTDANDDDATLWLERAEQSLKDLLKHQSSIVLIGFSMGGVIAADLATRFGVDKLILIAPAFDYLTLKNVKSAVEKKTRQRLKFDGITPMSTHPPLPEHFTAAFQAVVKLGKHAPKLLNTPTLLIHGTEDEVIPLRSSHKAYQAIQHPQKRLFILQGVAHRVLDDPLYQKDVLTLLQRFIEEKRMPQHPNQ